MVATGSLSTEGRWIDGWPRSRLDWLAVPYAPASLIVAVSRGLTIVLYAGASRAGTASATIEGGPRLLLLYPAAFAMLPAPYRHAP